MRFCQGIVDVHVHRSLDHQSNSSGWQMTRALMSRKWRIGGSITRWGIYPQGLNLVTRIIFIQRCIVA